MAKSKAATQLKKPTLSDDDVLGFAEGSQSAPKAPKGQARAKAVKSAHTASDKAKSGLVPQGDVRLTANMRQDLHLKLKIRAAEERTTIGELIENWVSSW